VFAGCCRQGIGRRGARQAREEFVNLVLEENQQTPMAMDGEGSPRNQDVDSVL